MCFQYPPKTSILFFFFLMIRRPPRSTLFPTRRSSDLHLLHGAAQVEVGVGMARDAQRAAVRRWHLLHVDVVAYAPFPGRSEEHTSELQSRLHLVCRLLLEKKKKKTRTELACRVKTSHTLLS